YATRLLSPVSSCYRLPLYSALFSSDDTAPTEIYTLSLHDALPIFDQPVPDLRARAVAAATQRQALRFHEFVMEALVVMHDRQQRDRKSTRLNSSHLGISYAVFCLKKKKKKIIDRLSEYDHN